MDVPHTAHDHYLARVDDLLHQGRQLLARLTRGTDAAGGEARTWQQQCASLVSDLSGGSKAHWLSRAHSDAFLVRAMDGRAVDQAPLAEILMRLIGVLEQAKSSLAAADQNPVAAPQAPAPRRFDFVHDAALRPILEAAYLDGRRALEEGRFSLALVTCCSVLEAIVTDALTRADGDRLRAHGAPDGPIAGWTFDERLSCAERAGLIRGGCGRLPPVARRYAALADARGSVASNADVTERDARTAGQVLRVVMRDLNPGR